MSHKVYPGYGNKTYIEAYKDVGTKETLDMASVTDVQLCVGKQTYTSDDHPDEIQWLAENAGTAEEQWIVEARFGLLPDIPNGNQRVALIVYDTDYPNGLVVAPDLAIEIVPIC